jgi:hypothetical protein
VTVELKNPLPGLNRVLGSRETTGTSKGRSIEPGDLADTELQFLACDVFLLLAAATRGAAIRPIG